MDASIKPKYFYLFADCFPVKGYLRTMLLDIGRRAIYFVDNSYFELLTVLKTHPIGEVLTMLEGEEDMQEFEKFLSYMTEKELGIIVDDLSLFPPIEVYWDHPSPITNAIIDIRHLEHDYASIFAQLDTLGCRHLQIRAYEALSRKDIFNILASTAGRHFRDIQIITKYDDNRLPEPDIAAILAKYPKLCLTIHSSPFNKWLKNDPLKGMIDLGLGFVMYIKQPIDSCSACGIINSQTMHIPAIETLMENMTYNGCLNRKISVDEHGEIKNCPSMTTSYGNIKDTQLTDVVRNDEFRTVWHIKKDDIEVCKDCEYRYICTDCRAYTTDPGSLRSKPSKCRYDPYTGQWSQ